MMANEKRYTEWLTGVKHLVYKVKKSKQTDIATMAGVRGEVVTKITLLSILAMGNSFFF